MKPRGHWVTNIGESQYPPVVPAEHALQVTDFRRRAECPRGPWDGHASDVCIGKSLRMISAQLGKVFMGLHRQPERGVTTQVA